MAYLSDVDLATLHRSRLEERVHYKLSTWWNQRSATVDSGLGQPKPVKVTPPSSSRSASNMDDIVNNNNGHRHSQQNPQMNQPSTCRPAASTAASAQVTTSPAGHRAGAGRHQSNVHVIKRRSRNSNSCSSTTTSASSSVGSSSAVAKHVEWSDDDYLNDDGYFSSETRRRRSGTWPRTRSLNAPSPFQQFGPCGRIMKNSAMVMQIQDPASQRLTWYKPPLAVLVIKKVRDSKVLSPFVKLVEWLIQEKHMVVWVEGAILDDPLLTGDKRFTKIQDKLITFK